MFFVSSVYCSFTPPLSLTTIPVSCEMDSFGQKRRNGVRIEQKTRKIVPALLVTWRWKMRDLHSLIHSLDSIVARS